ncbi:DUF3472 domain-containing protein [Mucilaginibacter sp. X4EP1]|uniref:DUF3472 domain-containing protein n=1 Tax=Mucilaginibacter sp. X4EP1 TaxID=2723092 RepID=UPI002167FCCF|nr:DUF3472 domain-containing protein [Mucilaginibacter sp. X4EP1]MCS3812531.1 hypothetical protein [Mucilaginibacter sp. X4EP1]
MKCHKAIPRPFLFCCLCLAVNSFVGAQTITDSVLNIPIGGNSWRADADTTGGNITNDGIVNWTNATAEFTTYIRLAKKGTLKIWLNGKIANGQSSLNISINNLIKRVAIDGASFADHYAGDWTITDTGYIAIKIKGIKKTSSYYADINSFKIAGTAVDAQTAYVKNNDGDFFYWGRRGPSVHLSYMMPEKMNVEWFYNEVTVPPGNDVLHSYFMADGFGEGYFGMQVNSLTERHILFSVWSPYKTDNPGVIPDSQKIVMLKKGDNVHTGEFGNEGSGGQSYLLYNWKAGSTYKFLMKAQPDGSNHTVYTAWFFAPEVNKWQLIASFSRPQTNTWLKHLHSFLENFEPEQGTITRKVLFTNQWIADGTGKWMELNKARFTVDNTGAKGYRMDYAGGTDGAAFYLKNCGFFNNYTLRNTLFERSVTGKVPDIDFNKLP